MTRKVSELVVKLTDQVTGPAAKMQAALKKAQADLSKVQAYKDQKAALDRMSAAHEKARENVRQLGAALMANDRPSKAIQNAYERATQAADKLGNRLQWQQARVRGAEHALTAMGASVNKLTAGENALRAATDRASAAIAKQQARAEKWRVRREAMGGLAAGAGVAAGYGAKNLAKKATVDIAEFDIATRKQREFTDITAKDQADILKPQALRIAQATQFTNLDLVKAQTKAMQGLPTSITGRLKAEVAEGIIENVKNYALVMEADMETAAEAIRSYLQSTGKDISTKEKALTEANKATNQLVKMAKLGGMSDEDVQQYIKYAAASGTAAGLTPESMMSIAALARRGGLRGDEAGVFMRSTASKLVAPTKDGLAALNAAGIRHSDYVRMPSSLSADGLQGQFRNDMGLNFTAETRKKLESVLGNKDLLGDRGQFVTAVTEAISGQMEKTKKGTMKPADRVKVAKAAGKFHQMSAETVDAEGLLDAVMQSNMTLAQLNAFLTNKHGGKGAITQKQREEYIAARKQLRETGDDPNFAKKKADEIMGGIGGSFEQAKGAVETFTLKLGEANEGLIRLTLDGFSGILDKFNALSPEVQRATTYIGGLAAVAGTVYGSAKLLGLLTGGGSAAALTGSAAALDASAAALTAAAAKLGGGVPGVDGGKPKPGGIRKTASMLGVAGLYGAGAYLLYEAGSAISDGNADLYKNVAPGDVHNEGNKRRAAYEAERRRRHEEFLRLYGEGSKATASELGLGTVSPGLKSFGLGGPSGKSNVDLKELEAAKTKASEAKDAFNELDTTVTPKVDTASLREAVSYAQALTRELAKVPGLASGATASVGRGRSEVATATANLRQSRLSNEQDRPVT